MTKINGTQFSKSIATPHNQEPKREDSTNLFNKLDTNKDNKISGKEIYDAGYQELEAIALKDALFFAERTVNKWFIMDKNKDARINNIEMELWELHNNNPNGEIEDYTLDEFAKKNGLELTEHSYNDLKNWTESWITDKNPMVGILTRFEQTCGRKATQEETQILYDAMKNQMNRWLFKEDALYNNLSLTSYTRLSTTEQTISYCGGSIDLPPIGPQDPNMGCAQLFRSLSSPEDSNSAEEVKNRLAWGMFKTLPQEHIQQMSPSAYKHYQKTWNTMRNITASDFRELAKPENETQRKYFEQNSLMSINQIVKYIDIVESVTGVNFDSDDWSINTMQYHEIMEKINGTYDDVENLEGKSRKDIPSHKQNLLKYLEENDLLLDQFKE